jgi:hypothetical protein
VLEAWSVGREIVDQTRRWPVVVEVFAHGPVIDLRARRRDMDKEAKRAAGKRALAAMRESSAARNPGPLVTRLEYQLNCTRRRCGGAPSPVEVLAALPQDAQEDEVDRWLMAWEEARKPTTGPEGGEHLRWFSLVRRAALTFFPTDSGPETLAYTGGWIAEGAPGATLDRLIAIIEYREERYGAELVANWGTMLEFTVARPPLTLDEAWPLALEQVVVAPDTIHGPVLPIRAHARALIQRSTWFLHARP